MNIIASAISMSAACSLAVIAPLLATTPARLFTPGVQGHGKEAKDQLGHLLKREEVAEQLGVSPRTVARLVERGNLACVRLGRLARFRPLDVAALVAARLNTEAPERAG
jgi:excisionase family DNA binding protein